MMYLESKGDFTKTFNFLEKAKHLFNKSTFDKYGEVGVEALRQNTPKDSGKTADSWYYKVSEEKGRITITWLNRNINDGVPIAIILQYGHGTGTGGYVKGIDYINPAMKSVFDQIAEDAWREVTKS